MFDIIIKKNNNTKKKKKLRKENKVINFAFGQIFSGIQVKSNCYHSLCVSTSLFNQFVRIHKKK